MSWARIDDGFHDHTKVVDLDLEVIGLWTLCLTWAHKARKSSKNPGQIPKSVVRRFAGSKGNRIAARLVDAGLWNDIDGDGWAIHDFADYLQKHDSEQARAAGAAGGKARAANQAAKQTASEPLSETQADEQPNTQANSSTRASARRNPVPVPKPKEQKPDQELWRSAPKTIPPDDPSEITARHLTGIWIDEQRETDAEPTKSVIGKVSRSAKELLDAGNDPLRCVEVARSAGRSGYTDLGQHLTIINGRASPPPQRQTWHDDKGNPTNVSPPAFDPWLVPLNGSEEVPQ